MDAIRSGFKRYLNWNLTEKRFFFQYEESNYVFRKLEKKIIKMQWELNEETLSKVLCDI